MKKTEVSLLDCTLRDGGYINNWNWGFESAKDIIYSLNKAGIEIIEVGFLRNIDKYNPDVTISNSIEDLNKLLPLKSENVMYSAMAMQSNYDISQLQPYSGKGIEMIRVTAHENDLDEGIEFAHKAVDKGYKVSFNPINIMGYSDAELLEIFRKISLIKPYQFSIVDTFGSMKKKDYDRIVRLADHNLDSEIRLGLHLHENMSMACCLSQDYASMHLHRPMVIDGSLAGMGRTPGNLPIELIADYLNDTTYKSYDIDYLLDAIQDYIKRYKGETKWGYSTEYFISARLNIHRNYAEHLLNKGDLTCKDINHILAKVTKDKAAVFDSKFVDDLYSQYKNNSIDDSDAIKELRKLFNEKKILIIAPGASITEFKEEITEFIKSEKPIVISLNFLAEDYEVDYAFFSNNKRVHYLENFNCKTIVTSNVSPCVGDYVINYNRMVGDFPFGVNSLIYLLRLLKALDTAKVFAAGADGYMKEKEDYYTTRYKSDIQWDDEYNKKVIDAIRRIGIVPSYITPSAYDEN
jgi:4-hydroxy 2-oxovalerate aldolase